MSNSLPTEAMDTPQAQNNFFMTVDRFVNPAIPGQILIYTDGCCFNNGQDAPTAGCGFAIGPPSSGGSLGGFSFRLEDRGPSYLIYDQTNNRAELRAVIAALQFNEWDREGWDSLCILSDSAYVVRGITEWIQAWTRNGWLTAQGGHVANRDLWEQLLHELRTFEDRQFQVSFQWIPRGENLAADQLARDGADMPDVEFFTPYHL